MKDWTLYRAALCFLPAKGKLNETELNGDETRAALCILKKQRCTGAVLCLFDETGAARALTFGEARKGLPVRRDTPFRLASVSKFVTALGAMRLKEQGKIGLDRDVNEYLPFPVRHPKAPDTPITLRMLLSHTAGIHDGADYNSGIAQGVPCAALLRGDSFCAHLPGEKWEYSNFGAGIAGAVLEAATGKELDALMRETVFAPLHVEASYYPQRVKGCLSDARRILPPSKRPNFDGAARQQRPQPDGRPDPERHYALAHGNLCTSAPDLCRIGAAGMEPGFLRKETLAEMRRVVAPFGERADDLSQGIGTFVLQNPAVSQRPLYGHQGMAYGAVHGLFFDPIAHQGMALLTVGASEARRGVLADLNRELLAAFLRA